jgi:hypothetical protein
MMRVQRDWLRSIFKSRRDPTILAPAPKSGFPNPENSKGLLKPNRAEYQTRLNRQCRKMWLTGGPEPGDVEKKHHPIVCNYTGAKDDRSASLQPVWVKTKETNVNG